MSVTNVALEVSRFFLYNNKVFPSPTNKKKWIFLISFAPVCCVLMLQWRSYTKSHYCSTGCRNIIRSTMKTPDDIIAIANALAKVPYAPRIIVGNITFEPNFVVFLLLLGIE